MLTQSFPPNVVLYPCNAAVYSGLQTASPNPIYFGLVWHNHDEERGGFIRLRERVTYSDRLNFKVIRADGVSFGQIEIVDDLHDEEPLLLTVSWVKTSDTSFLYRVEGNVIQSGRRSQFPAYISVFLYVGVDGDESFVDVSSLERNVRQNWTQITGFVQDEGQVGSFGFRSLGDVVVPSDVSSETGFYATRTDEPFYATSKLKTILIRGVEGVDDGPSCCYPLNHDRNLPNVEVVRNGKQSNFVVFQRVLKTPFVWTSAFGRIDELDDFASSGNDLPDFDAILEAKLMEFESKFDSRFPVTRFEEDLHDHPALLITDESWRDFGMRVLSGLLNGLSFFQGDALVKNMETGVTSTLTDRKLLTLVPGKMGFPRGFYWDEGFHEMVMARWDPGLHSQISEFWYALQDPETGWIAREQVIGKEAFATTPEWAWPGLSDQMNPPSFFLATRSFLRLNRTSAIPLLRKLLPRFELVFRWYQTVCSRGLGTFGWNGRKNTGDSAFDSGLDDFPRFRTFDDSEQNVDLQAWLIVTASIIEEIASSLGDDELAETYHAHAIEFTQRLHDVFWSDDLGFYVDARDGELSDHVGASGMLPFCLGLEEDETRITAIMDWLRNPTQLFTEYGFASLSLSGPDFRRSGNYWRGNIWINLNYLCLQGLKEYESRGIAGSYGLRKLMQANIATNMFRNYYERLNGGIFETFHPLNGRGYNHLPFVGWSSLVLLMMSEDYV